MTSLVADELSLEGYSVLAYQFGSHNEMIFAIYGPTGGVEARVYTDIDVVPDAVAANIIYDFNRSDYWHHGEAAELAKQIPRSVIALINDPARYDLPYRAYFLPFDLADWPEYPVGADPSAIGKDAPLVFPNERRFLLGNTRYVMTHAAEMPAPPPGEAVECPICYEPLPDRTTRLPRKHPHRIVATRACTQSDGRPFPHIFHRECLRGSLRTRDDCPVCRTPIVSRDVPAIAASGASSQETTMSSQESAAGGAGAP